MNTDAIIAILGFAAFWTGYIVGNIHKKEEYVKAYRRGFKIGKAVSKIEGE